MIQHNFLTEMSEKEYEVIVDYNRSLTEMIQAGNYDWTNSDITATHFPIKGKGRHEIKITLFSFIRDITSNTIISEIHNHGFYPARIEELLALGESYPDLQKQFAIVAFGSICLRQCGDLCVAFLGLSEGERDLGLFWFVNEWSPGCRFAAIRK